MNEEWRMMNDEWLSIPWITNDEWWMKNDHWWILNDDRWMIESLNWFISQKERLNSSQPSCVTESTELVHITRGKTELIPSWLCNRKHSSSSKCSTEKSHQFISKVSQKLDYCLSTHTLTHTHTHTEPCHGTRLTFMILSKINLDWFMNDEWRMMNSTLLHRKKQNWTVPHPNRLNRFPSEQRTRRCYNEKD